MLASFLVSLSRCCKSDWLLVLCGILRASFLCSQVLGLYIFFKGIALLDYIHIHIVNEAPQLNLSPLKVIDNPYQVLSLRQRDMWIQKKN